MANLVELFDNIVQMQNLNGVPLANGKMYVYALGRTRLMDTWSDVDGESLNPNPIILDAAGQCHCYVTDDFDYTIVVTDTYDNEIFSIDKYLYSKGSHSHADVAVAPSETIAVSSYHVGETTVYVPYLTGQLGKVYEGIEPIVVNNDLDKISAQHVPLGVQDPLYFVQDDEEGCIIGFSGQTVPEGVMTESALGFENDKITGYNGSAFSAGNEYEAGSYIDITDNTISVTGLTPVPSDTASTGLVAQVSADIVSQIPSTAGLATTAQLDEKLDKADSANFYPMNSNPSGYITAHQSLDGYATENWVTFQGYLTGVDIPESANWNSTYNTVSANSAQWAGGTANPQIPVTGINGIKISESADKVVFEVSGDYATNTQLQTVSGEITALIPTALTGEYLDKASADTLYYPLESNPNGYLTAETDWTNTITAASANAYAEATAAIPTGLATTADLQTVSGEITAMIPSTAGLATEDWVTSQGYITGVDLTPYQTTADMVNYQPVSSMTAYQPTGNYITAVPDTYLQNTDLSTEDGKVTAISGIPLSAGGDVPEGVMVESGLEFNAVNEISGYNGSAIAQYGAEKQWLTHDDTIVDVSNSAQYAFGVNLSGISADLARMMSVDETLLWSGNSGQLTADRILTLQLTEAASSFEKVEIYNNCSYGNGTHVTVLAHNDSSENNQYPISVAGGNADGNSYYVDKGYVKFSGTSAIFGGGSRFNFTSPTTGNISTNRGFTTIKIIGIGRKS